MSQAVDERLCQVIKDWIWDKYAKGRGNKLITTIKAFGYIVSFICAKQLLEPMQSLVTCQQFNFVFKEIN